MVKNGMFSPNVSYPADERYDLVEAHERCYSRSWTFLNTILSLLSYFEIFVPFATYSSRVRNPSWLVSHLSNRSQAAAASD